MPDSGSLALCTSAGASAAGREHEATCMSVSRIILRVLIDNSTFPGESGVAVVHVIDTTRCKMLQSRDCCTTFIGRI